MKLLTLVLSIYVLLLNSLACVDAIEAPSFEKTTIIQNASKVPVHSDCCSDLCSPFCACGCCIAFTKPHGVILKPIIIEIRRENSFSSIVYYYADPVPLVQPPKVRINLA